MKKYRVSIQAHAVEQAPPHETVNKADEATGPLVLLIEAEDATAALTQASMAVSQTVRGHARALALLERLAAKIEEQS